MSGLLSWVLSCVLFLGAVASLVFSVLVIDHENRYLSWVGVVIWAVLCLALAFVVKAGFLGAPLFVPDLTSFARGAPSEVSKEGEVYYLSRGSKGLVGKLSYAG